MTPRPPLAPRIREAATHTTTHNPPRDRQVRSRQRGTARALALFAAWRRGCPLVVLVVAAAASLAGCGGSKAPAVANVATPTQSTSTASQSTSASGTAGSPWSYARGVAYAKCMRAHGVANFPDPGGGGTTNTGSGIDPNSPTFQSAAAACAKLSPEGSAPRTRATTRQIKQALRTSECMRKHGVAGFPDPIATATPPAFGSAAGKYSLTEYSNGILIEIPLSIDVNSPIFEAAAKNCNFNTGNPGQQTGNL